MLVGQRAQRLGGHLPANGLDGQLAAAARHDLTLDRDLVADVDEPLERVELLLADLGQGQHGLQLGAVAGTQPGETELAGVAQEDHSAGDSDLVAGARVRA